MLDLWIATSNQGKLSEFKSLLAGIQIHSPSEMPVYSYPKETGKTFVDNARLKARSLSALKKQFWVVGEDSGLEVEGLEGMPGIFSARYAGDRASDSENCAKVLKMLQIRSPLNRRAQFRCVIVAMDPQGQEHIIEGILKGEISQQSRGRSGFGYDPIFIPEGHSQTLAEMGGAKNAISHRAKATRELSELLKASTL
jgi:XTP/dITP diphosphohydrolase